MTPRMITGLTGLFLVLAIAGLIYMKGRSDVTQARDLDDATNQIDTREDIDDALSCSPELSWFDRLHVCAE